MRSLQEITNSLISKIVAEQKDYNAGVAGMVNGIHLLAQEISKELSGGEESQAAPPIDAEATGVSTEPSSGPVLVPPAVEPPGC